MEYTVRHVYEVRLTRADPTGDLYGVVDGEVCRMIVIAQSIQHEHVKPSKEIEAFLGDEIRVREVGEVAHAIPEERQVTVVDIDGHDLDGLLRIDATRDAEGSLDHFEYQIRHARIRSILEDVPEHPAKNLGRVGPGIARNRPAVSEKEGTKIVQPHDVIEMMVRKQHRIHMPKSFPEGLGTKIGTRVDDDVDAVVFDEARAPRSPVTQVGGRTYAAAAADDRNSRGRTRSEERDAHGFGAIHPRRCPQVWMLRDSRFPPARFARRAGGRRHRSEGPAGFRRARRVAPRADAAC